MNIRIEKRDLIILGICIVILLLTICIMTVVVHKEDTELQNMQLTFEPIVFLDVDFKQPNKRPSTSMSFGADESFSTHESFSGDSAVLEEVIVTATGPNAEIYNLASAYFNVSYGYQPVSPILPLAIANVETPGRCDFSKTWSAIFPSKVVPVEEIQTFDVVAVATNPDYFAVLSKEYSTRDRGALQMSPTYGTNNNALNAKMSGTEKQKLSSCETSSISSWVKGASDSPGDRFYLPDVLLRMSAAMQQQCNNMAKNSYPARNDMQLIAMLAMGHHNSGIWYFSNHSKKVGVWHSGERAYEWVSMVGSEQMVKVLSDYAKESDDMYIDSNKAKALFRQVYTETPSSYATKDIVCWYPIKALYSYIKLCMMYTS